MNILITNAHKIEVLSGTIYSLRSSFECNLIGVGKKTDTSSLFLNEYYNIDDSLEIVNELNFYKDLIKKHSIEVIFPHSIEDRLFFMNNKEEFSDVIIISSSSESILVAEDKIKLSEIAKEIGISVPKQIVVRDSVSLKESARELGYPEKKVIVKPVRGKGSRGFRILNDNLNLKSTFYGERGGSVEITLKGLLDILEDDFAPLIISQYLPGEEYTVDCLREGNVNVAIPRVRSYVKNGKTEIGTFSNDNIMIKWSLMLAEKLDLTTVFGFQYKMDEDNKPYLLECNPRIQGTTIMTVLGGANIIAESVRLKQGKEFKEFDVDWNAKFYRMPDALLIGKNNKFLSLEKSFNR